MKGFWEKFDSKGYSIWFMHYDKTKSQGESMLRASNFHSMFLQVILPLIQQKLNDFRKWCFGVFGIYGDIPNLEFEAIWMWRGTEIPEQIKSHDSYDYSDYKPLNVNSAEDRELILSFWLNTYIKI